MPGGRVGQNPLGIYPVSAQSLSRFQPGRLLSKVAASVSLNVTVGTSDIYLDMHTVDRDIHPLVRAETP